MKETLGAPDAAKVDLEDDEAHCQYAREDENKGVQPEKLSGSHSQHTRGKGRLGESFETIGASKVSVSARQLEKQNEGEEECHDVVGKINVQNESQEVERVAEVASLAKAHHKAEGQHDGQGPQRAVDPSDEPKNWRSVVHVFDALLKGRLHRSCHSIVPSDGSQSVELAPQTRPCSICVPALVDAKRNAALVLKVVPDALAARVSVGGGRGRAAVVRTLTTVATTTLAAAATTATTTTTTLAASAATAASSS